LEASNKAGGSTTQTDIRVLQKPVAGIDTSAEVALVAEAFRFMDNSTGDIASYIWNFGDGTAPVTEKNPTHVFGSAGEFVVSLKVSNEVWEDSNTRQIKVLSPVKAEFSASLTLAKFMDTIKFTDNSTGDIISYLWNFGDGTEPVTEKNPSHKFMSAGDITVSLQVSNYASRDTKTMQIKILHDAAADFSVSTNRSRTGESIQFIANSKNEVNQWKWDFGDGFTSTEENPTHTYSTDGIYTISLEVRNPVSSAIYVEKDYITISTLDLNLYWCSNVATDGSFTLQPDSNFNKGDPVFLYLEIGNFQHNPVANGFESWTIVQSANIIRTDKIIGVPVVSYINEPELHRTSTKESDHDFAVINFGWIVSAISGEFRVDVIVLDKLSGHLGIRSITFTVK
jgi:PKD repeat protein